MTMRLVLRSITIIQLLNNIIVTNLVSLHVLVELLLVFVEDLVARKDKLLLFQFIV